MLSFLRPPSAPRTKTSHLTTLTMENGRSSISFHQDPNTKKSSHIFTVPPCARGPNPKENSIITPPFHAHPNQEEIFLVTEGTALFFLDFKEIPVSARSEITISRRAYHKFCNASSEQRVVLEGWYHPAEPTREKRFFSNLYGYLNDATLGAEGGSMMRNASVAQIALFAWEADMLICEPVVKLGLPNWIGIPISYALTWVLGVFVGKWMLGYESSYDEYYHESST